MHCLKLFQKIICLVGDDASLLVVKVHTCHHVLPMESPVFAASCVPTTPPTYGPHLSNLPTTLQSRAPTYHQAHLSQKMFPQAPGTYYLKKYKIHKNNKKYKNTTKYTNKIQNKYKNTKILQWHAHLSQEMFPRPTALSPSKQMSYNWRAKVS